MTSVIYKEPYRNCPFCSPPQKGQAFWTCKNEEVYYSTLDHWVLSCEGCPMPKLVDSLMSIQNGK